MPRHYSPSQLRTWLRCARAWAWRYVRGVISPPAAVLVVGKAVHVSAATWHSRGLDLGTEWSPDAAAAALSAEEAGDLTAGAFDRDAGEVPWENESEDRGRAKDRAVRMGVRYVSHVGPSTGRPLAVEQRHDVAPEGRDWTLVTILDAATEDGGHVVIRDTKSSGKAPVGARSGPIVVPSDHRRQLAAYRYAWRWTGTRR